MTAIQKTLLGNAFVEVKDGFVYGITGTGGAYFRFPFDAPNGTYAAKALKEGILSEYPKTKGKSLSDLFPPCDPDRCFELDPALIVHVLPFVSDDKTRYFMNGVAVYNRSTVAATDGRRLVTNGTIEYLSEKRPKILLVQKLERFYKAASRVLVGDSGAWIIGDNFEIYAPHIDGQYPNITRVIPDYANVPTPVKIDLTLGDYDDTVKKCKALDVSGFARRNGQWIIDAEKPFNLWTEDGPDVAINPVFLRDAKKAGLAALEGIQPDKALVGTDSSGFLHVIMPCTINQACGAISVSSGHDPE